MTKDKKMKRNFAITGFVLAIIAVVAFPLAGVAATGGNLIDTQGGAGKFSFGLEVDRVFNRDMKYDSGTISGKVSNIPIPLEPALAPGEGIKNAKIRSNSIFLKGTVGVHPNLDLFIKLGRADGRAKFTDIHPLYPDTDVEFDGGFYNAWGVGAKAKLFETLSGLRLMADAQYLRHKVDGKIKANGRDIATAFVTEALAQSATAATASYTAQTELNQWQLALYMNQTFGRFSPYVGVKYSNVKAENNVNITGLINDIPYAVDVTTKFKADKQVGLVLGVDFHINPSISPNWSIHVEGRFMNETAGTVGMNWKF